MLGNGQALRELCVSVYAFLGACVLAYVTSVPQYVKLNFQPRWYHSLKALWISYVLNASL